MPQEATNYWVSMHLRLQKYCSTIYAVAKFNGPDFTLNDFPTNCRATIIPKATTQIAAWIPKLTLVPCAFAHVTWKYEMMNPPVCAPSVVADESLDRVYRSCHIDPGRDFARCFGVAVEIVCIESNCGDHDTCDSSVMTQHVIPRFITHRRHISPKTSSSPYNDTPPPTQSQARRDRQE
jgi:hypothetical protein